MKKFIFFFFIFGFWMSVSKATMLTLPQVWDTVRQNSDIIQSAELSEKAADSAASRASRHWLPTVYAMGQIYETNDPTYSFMGSLSQRAVVASDFDPATLNHPGANQYKQGAIGVDVPLYQGGRSSAKSRQKDHLKNAKAHETDLVKVGQYAQVVQAYGTLMVLKKEKEKLLKMQQSFRNILGSYRVGVKGNPVGYSGELGLKSVENRVASAVLENEAKETEIRSLLTQWGLSESQWETKEEDIVSYLNRYAPDDKKGDSRAVAAHFEKSEAARQEKYQAQSASLPHVGAFAEKTFFEGERDSEDAYIAGVYVKWTLFSPTETGAGREARYQAQSEEKSAQAYQKQERARREGLSAQIQSLREGYKLIQKSLTLVETQTQTMAKLFRNGAINGLAFTEALSKRLDLTLQDSALQAQLIATQTLRLTQTNFELTEVKHDN